MWSTKEKDFQSKEKIRADFDWAFKLNRITLNVIGVWPSHVKDSIDRSLRAPFMCLWMSLGFFLPQMYALTLTHRHLPLLVDNVITSCASFIAIAKLFFIWYNRQAFKSLIPWTIADWAEEKNSWEHEVMIKQARRGRLFTITGYAIMFTNMVFFVISPFFDLSLRIINNITDIGEKRFLPLQSFYPYDFTKTPYFELTYVSQLVAIGLGALSFSAADNFFGALVFHASGQCEILAARMARILNFLSARTQAVEFSQSEVTTFESNVRHVVEFHVYLIRFVIAVEKSFNLLILAHAVGLSVIICFVGYGAIQALKESFDVMQIFPLAASLMNMLLHMFIYCIATETLTSNSAEFFRAIYKCNWHLLPTKCASDIMLIMTRSSFPLILTAGKFFNLSLFAYVQVVKSSVGYISVLLAVS